MNLDFPHQKIALELDKAVQFELNQALGKSRVCARKAAGIALQFWFQQHKQPFGIITPFKAIELFYTLPELPVDLHEPTRRLLQKVDQDYQFPEQFNLIMEAKKIIFFVKSQSEENH